MIPPSGLPKWMRDDYTPDDYREDLRKALAIAVAELDDVIKYSNDPIFVFKAKEALQRIHALGNGGGIEMAFPDENLEKLKEDFVIDKEFHANAMWIDRNKFHALLHRLECAERFITEPRCQNGCTCDNECEKHLPLEKAWRKSKVEGVL